MNILFVIHTPKSPYSAVYRHYAQLSAHLKSQRNNVAIISPEDFPGLNRWHARWFVLFYPFFVARWLRRQAVCYDIISFHSYAGWVVNLLHRLIPAFWRLQTVTSFHGLEPLYYNELKVEMKRLNRPLRARFKLIHGLLIPMLIRLSCRHSDWVICRNAHEVIYLVKNKWAKAAKIQMVSNGVAQDFFRQRQYARRASRLLCLAQWREMKGTHYLVEAFGALAREREDLELWCVGTLIDEELVRRSFPAELQSRVTVRPRVGHQELIEIYHKVDVFVFPTLSEGFSNALLEAMAVALPIVTTPVGAAGELLEHGVSALIVPKRDARALVDSIGQLLDDQPLREKLGVNASNKAREYILTAIHAEKAVLYKRMLPAQGSESKSDEATEDCSTF